MADIAKRWSLRIVVVLGLVLQVGLAFAADAIFISATPVPMDPRDDERRTLDRLTYRGGVVLESPEPRFGGWSDLKVSPDGSKLLAISDRGFWFDAGIIYDANGQLLSLADARLGNLIGPNGRQVSGVAADAEGLAVGPDGSYYISFERRHRIWQYPAAEPPFSLPPRTVLPPARLRTAPSNGGIEALLRLSNGKFLALVEELMDGDAHVGWIGDERRWDELHYRAAEDFKPTGLAEFPPGTSAAGDVAVLERRFTFFSGPGARITRIRRDAIRAGATLEGEELARLQLPLNIDNFEGLAIARGRNGSARLYLMSDDNYSFLQRTLLLMFEYAEEPAPASSRAK
jgi:hypothetical protein